MESLQINEESYAVSEAYVPNTRYMLALTSENKVDGIAELTQMEGLPVPDSEHKCFFFNRLFVNPKSRGKGLDGFLLERVLDFAQREKKAFIMELIHMVK